MAKWARRGRGRRSWAVSMYWYADREDGANDGQASAGNVGVGTCSGDAVAACGVMEPGAAVVLEADAAAPGEAAGKSGAAVETGAAGVV